MTGGVGRCTVKRRVVDVVMPPPSVTLSVIVAVPLFPDAGVIFNVRVAPVPSKIRLAVGTSKVLLEVPFNIKEVTGVRSSPTVKASAAVAVPTAMF